MAGEKTLAEGGQTSLDIESADLTAQANKAEIAAPVSSQIRQDASQADITNEDLFPGMNQKINVGSSSSQTLGTQPIFVAAGQYVPYNILNKKEEAIAAASKKRAERQAKFDPEKVGQLKNQLYQRQLNNRFNDRMGEVIKTAQIMDPDNWDKNLNNPGTEIGKIYAQQKSNFNVLATESNVLFEKAAHVIADAEKGGLTQYSPEVIQMARDIANKTGDAIEGDSLEDLRPLWDEFNGRYSLDKHLLENKYVTQVKADITSSLEPGGGGMSVVEKADYTKRAEALAKQQTGPGGQYEEDDLITYEVYRDRLLAQWGISETRVHKQDRQPTTYDKKLGATADMLTARVRRMKEAQLNPKGDSGRIVSQGAKGTTYKKQTIKDVTVLDPEDWKTAKVDKFNPFISSLVDQKDKYDNTSGPFSHKKADVADEVKKLLRSAGISSGLKVSYPGGKKSNIFNIEITPDKYAKDKTVKKIALDIADQTSIDAFEDVFIGSVYGSTDFKNESVSILDLADTKGKVTQREVLKVNSPEWAAITNTVLNTNAGQDKDVQTDKVLNEMGYTTPGDEEVVGSESEQEGTTKEAAEKKTAEEKKAKFVAHQKTDAYKKEFEQTAKEFRADPRYKNVSDSKVAELLEKEFNEK